MAPVGKGIAVIDVVFEARRLSRGWFFVFLLVVVASRRSRRLVIAISVSVSSVTPATITVACFLLPTPLLVFLLIARISPVGSVRSAFVVVLFLVVIGVSVSLAFFFEFLAAHFCVGCQPFHFPQKRSLHLQSAQVKEM